MTTENKNKTIADGAYENFATGLGQAGFDKTEETRAGVYRGANGLELACMAVQDGVADRIVTLPPEACFSQDITIIGDEKGEILDLADDLGLFDALETAGEVQRLSGGALIVTEYSDVKTAADLSKPVKNGAEIFGYRVYSSNKVNLQKDYFEGDEPSRFDVTKIDGSKVAIDASRCTVVHGRPLPQELTGGNLKEGYFGVSVLKKCEADLKGYATIMGASKVMASETGAKLFSLENFNELLSRPDGKGVSAAKDVISLVSYSLNSCRSAFMGPNDKVTFMAHNFAGLPDIIKEWKGKLCASSGFPESILFGRTASGLAQTNEGDLKTFGELCHKWRKRYIYRPAMKLIKDLAARNANKKISGSFTWGAIDVMTEKELIEARAKQATTLNTYYQMGAISADEVRNAVFVNGHSFDVNLEK